DFLKIATNAITIAKNALDYAHVIIYNDLFINYVEYNKYFINSIHHVNKMEQIVNKATVILKIFIQDVLTHIIDIFSKTQIIIQDDLSQAMEIVKCAKYYAYIQNDYLNFLDAVKKILHF